MSKHPNIVNRESINVKDIDKDVNNPWKWEWLEVKDDKFFFSEFFRKLKEPGKALCIWCDAVLNYGGRGKPVLVKHARSLKHKSQIKLRKTNYRLPGEINYIYNKACEIDLNHGADILIFSQSNQYKQT